MSLTLAEITQKLESLEGWDYDDNRLSKSFDFDSAANALVFVSEVSNIAETLGHYPKIVINEKKVMLELSSGHGVSQKDFELAHQADLAR